MAVVEISVLRGCNVAPRPTRTKTKCKIVIMYAVIARVDGS